MNYTINKKKKNNIILSSSFLILYYLILGFSFIFKNYQEFDSILNGILSILFIIAFTYLYICFIDYFKYYALRSLQISTSIILVSEIIYQIIKLINIFKLLIPELIFSVLQLIIVIATIIWMVLLFRTKSKDYLGMKSIRKYAFGLIASFILGIFIYLVAMFSNLSEYVTLMYLPFIIPYFFYTEFAKKLHLENLKNIIT